MYFSLLQTAGFLIQGVGIAIFTPILSYYIQRFRTDSLSTNIKHKNKTLIYLLMAVSLFGLMIERPFVIACNTWNINKYIFNLPLWIFHFIDSVYISIFFTMNTIYLWLLFYSKQYHMAIAEIPWQKQINPRYRSWYIINKKKWGNPVYILLALIIPFCLYIAGQLSIQYAVYLLDIKTYSLSLMSSIFNIPCFILCFKAKQLFPSTDIFDTKKEITYQCIIAVIFSTIYSSTLVTESILFYYTSSIDQYTQSMIQFVIYLITESTASIILFIPSLLTIYTAFKQTLQLNAASLPHSLSIHINTMATTNGADRDASTPSSTERLGLHGMLELISTFSGFKSFMQHLVKEWAAENLLFVLELIEIKFEFQIKHFDFDPSVATPNGSILEKLTPSFGATPYRSRGASINALELNLDQLLNDEVYDDEDVIEHKNGAFPDCPPLRPSFVPELNTINSGVEMGTLDNNNNNNNDNDHIEKPKLEPVHSRSINKINLHKKTSSIKFESVISSYLHNFDGSIFTQIELPSGLPKSEVLNTKKRFIEQLYELYLKYIKPGSIHEINISWIQRKQISDLLERLMDGDDDKEQIEYDEALEYDMFNVMDTACIEILGLMLHSYQRFLLTDKYKNVQIINP